MTDNEKRAHDLAVAISIDICHISAKAQISKGDENVCVDYFDAYMNAYKTGLEAFEEKFPVSK